MDINNLLRDNIKSLQPYSSARSEFKGEASVFLDANENAWGSVAGNGYNRYPDPLQKALKEKISVLKGIAPGNIFLGNGSDEPIDLLIRAFCNPGTDQVIAFAPTYGMYQVAADINNIVLKQASCSSDFQPDIQEALGMADAKTKIIFICSPNNPTGNLVQPQNIEYLLQSFHGIVVLDEAYIDFAKEGSSWVPVLQQYKNLVILQTFSKAWGMAGLRLGMAFAGSDIIEVLNKIKPPYNISGPVQELALQALEKAGDVKVWLDNCATERDRLSTGLRSLNCVKKIYPSDANFLLVKLDDAAQAYTFLLDNGVVVRNRSSQPGCENCLRITIGTAAETTRLLDLLAQFDQMISA